MTKCFDDLPDELTRHWTKLAIDCYSIGCNCKKCIIPEIMTSQKCMMKYVVKELIKKHGKPEKINSKYFED